MISQSNPSKSEADFSCLFGNDRRSRNNLQSEESKCFKKFINPIQQKLYKMENQSVPKKSLRFLKDLFDNHKNLIFRVLPTNKTLNGKFFEINKFECKYHKSESIAYFKTLCQKDNLKILRSENDIEDEHSTLFCKKCLSNSPSFDDKDNSTKYIELNNLRDHIIYEYDKIKHIFGGFHFKKDYLDGFLKDKNIMLIKIKNILSERTMKIKDYLDSIMQIIKFIIEDIWQQINKHFDKELHTFLQNIDLITGEILNIKGILAKFDNLPNENDINTMMYKIKNSVQLQNYLDNQDKIFKNIYENLDGIKKTHYLKYKYIVYLLNKLHYQSQNLPSLSHNFNLDQYNCINNQSSTNNIDHLHNLIGLHYDLESKNALLINQFEDFSKEFRFENFKDNYCSGFKPLDIDRPDYFQSNINIQAKNLHFYDPNTKTLDLINIGELDNLMINQIKMQDLSGNLPFKSIKLLDINIPHLTKTIISPLGEIYFIGGDNSDATIMVDPSKTTSTVASLKASMNLKKYGHGLIMIGSNIIYSIGGYECSLKTDGQTTNCQMYNIKNDKWYSISNLNIKSNEPGVCNFNDKYIFKFGGYQNDQGYYDGIIERYNIWEDNWEILPTIIPSVIFDQNINKKLIDLGAKSFCWQINDEEIIILGGSDQNFLHTNKAILGRTSNDLEHFIDSHEEQLPIIEKKYEKKIELFDNSYSTLPLDDSTIYHGTICNNKLYCVLVKAQNNIFSKNIAIYENTKWYLVY